MKEWFCFSCGKRFECTRKFWCTGFSKPFCCSCKQRKEGIEPIEIVETTRAVLPRKKWRYVNPPRNVSSALATIIEKAGVAYTIKPTPKNQQEVPFKVG